MRVALVSTDTPFVGGGARHLVEWLEVMLREAGHEVERVYLPEVDAPDLLFTQMAAFRFIDLSAADRVICFRPQAHLVPHPNKVLWFIHHIRAFYDLWIPRHRREQRLSRRSAGRRYRGATGSASRVHEFEGGR